ncbi:RNA polymerase II elongation factor ELL2-like isoform X2 [Porites lutea]|uniref:RNA polymerase II elongation factor ELL2-like isoform X2 n=1 Tax=Porites lutea TaxID=51062 RepID=UPI003CC564F6
MLLTDGEGVYKVSGEEDAMAIVLSPKSLYNLISQTEPSDNRLLVHVKLTDSCLRALEEYQSAEVSPRRKPTIQFSGYQGSVSIPLKGDENTAKFELDCSVLQSPRQQGGMDCVQQPSGSKDIRTVGTVTHKINVRATDDSYQMTQQRMKEVEEERKGVSTKVINMPKKGSKKVIKGLSIHKPQNSVNSTVRRQIKSVSVGVKVSSSGPSKSLRERVIHLLAVKPYKKLELISRLTKDGVNLQKDKNSLTVLLQQVETWPGYSEMDRQALRRKMKVEMNDNPVVTSTSSPPKNTQTTKQPSKRVCSSESDRSSKRQRVAHINKNNNIVMKESISKDSPIATPKTSPDSQTEDQSYPAVKKEVVDSSTTANLENSINGVNSLESPEFMRKYKPITTYEQRCSYKRDFQAEYRVYEGLKEKMDSVSTKFTELQNKRQQFPEGSEKRKDTDDEIVQLYQKIQKDTMWQQTKKQCKELHTKLTYIKGLIAAYDKSIAST